MTRVCALALLAVACQTYTPEMLCPSDRELDWKPEGPPQCGYAVGRLPKTSECFLLNLAYDENHCDRTMSFRCANEVIVTQRIDITHMRALTIIETADCTATYEGDLVYE